MRRNIVITAIIFIGMALLGVFVFSDSYLRLGESFRDLGNSAAYYFCKLFGIENDTKRYNLIQIRAKKCNEGGYIFCKK